jgi:hypothetical protein
MTTEQKAEYYCDKNNIDTHYAHHLVDFANSLTNLDKAKIDEKFSLAIEKRIRAEHKKHSFLNWQNIAARKICSTISERLQSDKESDKEKIDELDKSVLSSAQTVVKVSMQNKQLQAKIKELEVYPKLLEDYKRGKNLELKDSKAEVERLEQGMNKLLTQLGNEHVTEEFCQPIIDECKTLLKGLKDSTNKQNKH